MSTLVVAKKDGEVCMAADTLTTFGCRQQPARYVANPDKILRVGDTYLGFVGWSVSQTVLRSALAHGLELPELRTELELFEFGRRLHEKLKDEYFLNPTEGRRDAWESRAR